MKKSKIISLHNILLIILLIVLLIPKKINSYYKIGYNEITGKIISCGKNNIIKSKEKILINDKNFKCKLGYTIKIKGNLVKPETNRNFNSFNYQNYLYSKKIYFILENINYKYLKKNTNILYKIRNKLEKRINKYKTKTYMKALILGDKDFKDSIKESYQSNGLSHLFSISGMHITIISTILLFILNKIFSNKISYLIIIIFLLGYTFILNFSPSVLRAILLFILFTLKKYQIFDITKQDFLILLVILNIIYNPYIIYDIGFLFSYIISYFLIVYKYIYIKEKSYILKSLKISLIAFISSIPIMINTYHYINPLTPFINLIFGPMISLLIYPLCLTNLVFPIDNLLYHLIKIMENMSLSLNNNIFLISLRQIDMPFIILYYLVIIYIFKSYNLKKLLIIIFIIIIHHNINYIDPSSFITMIDVGQGDSILVKLPYNKGNILVDTGGNINLKNDLAKSTIIPYLRKEGINTVDYLIITHGDYDHIGNAENLINEYNVKNIIINAENDNYFEKRLIKKNAKKMNYGSLKIDNYNFYFLKRKNLQNENDNSLIIYTKIKKKNILLMGDASKEEEKYILNKYNLNNIDILKVGHHGSKTSSDKTFIKKLNPKICLISAGKNNLYSHPHKETLKTLKNCYVYVTKDKGAIKIDLNNNRILTAR